MSGEFLVGRSENINLTATGLPKAPKIIKHGDSLVSASDFGREQVRKLMHSLGFSADSIEQIMSARTLSKLGHGYKEVTLRRTGERYMDHTNGVFLILLLEFGIIDTDLLSAAHVHDWKEDVRIHLIEMENLIKRAVSEGTYHLMDMVTNPKKSGDQEKDKAEKKRHYSLMKSDLRACVLKTADRCYNLRCLEIFHFDDREITHQHIETANKQIKESREMIMPLSLHCGYDKMLEQDIAQAERRVTELHMQKIRATTFAKVP